MTQTKILQGDCCAKLKRIRNNSIDLIITSPPYADQRKTQYGGIKPHLYVDWFLPISKELLRVLKPEGTFILNIKEHTENQEKHVYVCELVIALREQGWFWTEEFIWHKKNCFPGKWPNRFRNAWEHLFQFNKQKQFKMFQETVKKNPAKSMSTFIKNIKKNSERYKKESTYYSGTNSGFNYKLSNFIDHPGTVYPSNVLYLAVATPTKHKHSAVFPNSIPDFFIKLFTQKNDWVLDPFAGSGTSLNSAFALQRNSIGIEINANYCQWLYEDNIRKKFALVLPQKLIKSMAYDIVKKNLKK